MTVKTARGNDSVTTEKAIIAAMEILDIKMPPVVVLMMSDDSANSEIHRRKKDDDEYKKTQVQVISSNFKGHEIHLLIIGPTRGLKFSVSSDHDTIFVHIDSQE